MADKSLAHLVGHIAQSDGDFSTAIPGLTVYRRSAVSEPMHCVYGLSLALTLQGGKRVTLGEEVLHYGPGQSLITTVDLPVTSYVIRASAQEPFLRLLLELDARAITQWAADMPFAPAPREAGTRAMSVVSLDDGLLASLTRLVQLLDEPALVESLAPLIRQEIVVRLLRGPHGPTLRNLVAAGSPGQHIGKVIAWMRHHFTEDISVEDLATRAHMSPSTFRAHFRNVAGMSPLQYLKNLRLQEARHLMLNSSLDAVNAAVQVGYESASQFSREYRRMFGEPPLRDIHKMRQTSIGPAQVG
ncbi:AraC family transcriptional regulator [Rhodoferax saidenbachensis]|uniref:AraC family transcriptional regulator n=1 Tax=Rhodoferax saidenbachensis TaxID=1484693 RepID=A0A1P8KB10_9BURK|nr:AraC family transcriptional regulator [Rhodoferax saidenbachensis]APW43193.1 AraC family transcriptional regulator [Rhodoferax saidenbachensis]